jgi:hypothetical protein
MCLRLCFVRYNPFPDLCRCDLSSPEWSQWNSYLPPLRIRQMKICSRLTTNECRRCPPNFGLCAKALTRVLTSGYPPSYSMQHQSRWSACTISSCPRSFLNPLNRPVETVPATPCLLQTRKLQLRPPRLTRFGWLFD